MKKLKCATSHHAAEIEELRADRELAIEYLRAAIESLANPDERAGGLLALRSVAEAYGGIDTIASEAGTRRETFSCTLSPKDSPTLNTFRPAVERIGMRLSVEPLDPARL